MAVWAQTVADSFPDVYAYGGLLAGRDRRAAEELVRDAYSRLADAGAEAVADGSVVRSLRSLMRRRWLDRLAGQEPARRAHAGGDRRVIADLPDHVRVLVVLVAVDGMTQSRVARLTGVAEGDVDRLVAQARGWLGVKESADRRTWVRGFLGDEVRPSAGLVDELVALAPPRWAQPPPVSASEHSSVFEAVPATRDAWSDETDPAGLAALVGMDDSEAQPIAPATEIVDTLDFDGDVDGGTRPSWRRASSMPRWVPAAVAVLLLVIVVSVVATRGSGSGGTVTGAGTSVVASSSGAGSTVASSSSVASSPSSVAAGSTVPAGPPVTDDSFNPTCVERVDPTPLPTINERKADVFGPLTAKPTLRIPLPKIRGEEAGIPATDVISVAGGVKVVVYGDEGSDSSALMEFTVGVDGKVRLVDCGGTTADLGAFWGSSPELHTAPDQNGSHLDFYALGNAYVLERSALTYTDSSGHSWTDETLHNYDPGLSAGLVATPSGDMVAVTGCTAIIQVPRIIDNEGTEELAYACDDNSWVLRIYRPESGVIVRDVPGVTSISAMDDGYALVRHGDFDRLLDLTTGEFVPGQQWPAETFGFNASEGLSHVFAWLRGGIVVTCSDQGVLTVWYPAAVGLASHAVSLS